MDLEKYLSDNKTGPMEGQSCSLCNETATARVAIMLEQSSGGRGIRRSNRYCTTHAVEIYEGYVKALPHTLR